MCDRMPIQSAPLFHNYDMYSNQFDSFHLVIFRAVLLIEKAMLGVLCIGFVLIQMMITRGAPIQINDKQTKAETCLNSFRP